MNIEFSDKLSSMIDKLEDLNNILDKSKSNREDVSITILYKKVEDGILDHIHKANTNQLKFILSQYRFRYYTDFNTDKELLKNEINKRIRDKKLEMIFS
jgi:hypothetical protein